MNYNNKSLIPTVEGTEMQHKIDERTITLDAEDVVEIRRALLIGLQSYGEIERISSFVKALKQLGREVPGDCMPIHPTGSDSTIGSFADALHHLN